MNVLKILNYFAWRFTQLDKALNLMHNYFLLKRWRCFHYNFLSGHQASVWFEVQQFLDDYLPMNMIFSRNLYKLPAIASMVGLSWCREFTAVFVREFPNASIIMAYSWKDFHGPACSKTRIPRFAFKITVEICQHCCVKFSLQWIFLKK